MSVRDLSTLTLAEKTLAGCVVIQVLNDLRHAVTEGVALDLRALNVYEELKVNTLKIREPEAEHHPTALSEGPKQ